MPSPGDPHQRATQAQPAEPLGLPPALDQLPWDVAKDQFGAQGADFIGVMGALSLRAAKDQFKPHLVDAPRFPGALPFAPEKTSPGPEPGGRPRGEHDSPAARFQWALLLARCLEPIEADILVVDELSMVDVPLAWRLFQAVDRKRTAVVLVGDHNPAKVLQEAAAIADTLIRRAGRTLAEAIAVTDSALRTPGKILAESVPISDTLTRQPRRLLAEFLGFADTLGLGRLYSRILSEAIDVTDGIVVSWTRLLQFFISGRP